MELNCFEKNIEALARRYPRLAKKMRELPPPQGIFVKQSSDGLPILGVRRGDGQETLLYDQVNTRQKIEKDLKCLMFKAEDATLFLGFGLAYHVDEIAHRMELDHQLFVVEPCIEILRLALACRDLTGILSHEAIHLFAGKDLTRLHEMLEYHLLRLVAGQLNNITLSPLRATFAQIYAEAEDQIRKTLLHLKLTYRHLLENDVVLKNVLSNARELSTSLDVSNLFGFLKGKPAIVVSGGPSLTKNLAHVKEVVGKACVLAVDTALKPLLQAHIIPHFVVSLDPFEQNYKKFQGLSLPMEISLVYELGVCSKIPGHFVGYKFVSRNQNSLSRWLLDHIGFSESMGKATSAAHLAFFLARAMEADPIIFVGLDLSFPDDDHHVNGAAVTWVPKTDQEYLLVPDVSGGSVKTIPGFQAMIGLFETEIARTKARCVDATEGGALIRGTEIMTLSAALEKHVSGNRFDIRENLKRTLQSSSYPARKTLDEGLTQLLHEAQEISDLGAHALPLIRRATKMVNSDCHRREQFVTLSRQIQELDRLLGEKRLFSEVMIDFQAELVSYQYLQGYKIKRAKDPKLILRLSLESIERAFRSFNGLANATISTLRKI